MTVGSKMSPKPAKLVIVGGGAAGLFAAAVAAERRLPCVLVERKARPGAKMLMTANGRCNFTKDITAEQFLRDLDLCAPGTHDRALSDFVARAVRECSPKRLIDGFRSLSVPVRRMADGRMFPADGKAATIVHALGDILREAEVPILTNSPVTDLRSLPGGGFLVDTHVLTLAAENVLIATGGVSYPKTGSVGDGQNFARALGHRIVPYRPGLIGLETTDRRVTALAGQRFEDGRCRVRAVTSDGSPGPVLYEWRGEVDCERFGLSGAAVYNCQRYVARTNMADYALEAWFGRERLTLTNLRPRPLKEAIVTLGGVSREDVDPATMQSRRVPGLYFAGEVLDIDGPTGGYNLTLAFATARLAVTSILK